MKSSSSKDAPMFLRVAIKQVLLCSSALGMLGILAACSSGDGSTEQATDALSTLDSAYKITDATELAAMDAAVTPCLTAVVECLRKEGADPKVCHEELGACMKSALPRRDGGAPKGDKGPGPGGPGGGKGEGAGGPGGGEKGEGPGGPDGEGHAGGPKGPGGGEHGQGGDDDRPEPPDGAKGPHGNGGPPANVDGGAPPPKGPPPPGDGSEGKGPPPKGNGGEGHKGPGKCGHPPPPFRAPCFDELLACAKGTDPAATCVEKTFACVNKARAEAAAACKPKAETPAEAPETPEGE